MALIAALIAVVLLALFSDPLLVKVSSVVTIVVGVVTVCSKLLLQRTNSTDTRGRSSRDRKSSQDDWYCRAPSRNFFGREKILEEVDAVVKKITKSKIVGVIVLKGMGGAGKTFLAKELAREHKGEFKQLRLFDLNVYSGNPKKSHGVLAALLGGIAGFEGEAIPRDENDRKRTWQSWMAKTEMLFILENLSPDTPVHDLIPHHGRHLIVITTRESIDINPQDFLIMKVNVEGLDPKIDPNAAEDMFKDIVGSKRKLDEKDLKIVRKLLERCGYLPMAIRILASRLRDGTTTVTQVRDDFKQAAEALGVLDILDKITLGEKTISAAIESTYVHKTDDDKRVLCLLGLHPRCPDIDIPAAEALTNLDTPVTMSLTRLWDASLLEVVDYQEFGANLRYKLHDLVCDYVRRHANFSEVEVSEAIDRLFTHYWCTARDKVARADPFLTRHTRPEVDPNRWRVCSSPEAVSGDIPLNPTLDARTQALDWIDQHQAHLLACLDYAARHDSHQWVISFTSTMAGFLRNHGPWDQAIMLHDQAAEMANKLKLWDAQLARAVALNDQGIMLRLAGECDNALEKVRQAQDIFRSSSHMSERDALLGQANALNEQGIIHNLLGENRKDENEYRKAIDALKEALKYYEQIGDEIGEANAAKNLGVAKYSIGLLLRDAGQCTDAETSLNEAKSLLKDAINYYGRIGGGDQLGRVEVLNHQGFLQLRSSEIESALRDFEEAKNLVDRVGSLLEKARALEGVGLCKDKMGAVEDAVTYLKKAEKIYFRIGAERALDNVTKKLNEIQVKQRHRRRRFALWHSGRFPRVERTRR
ncbi:MAG: NB-ARC domain-containing protein [Pseudonocardiaceae bacterium]